MLQYTFTIPDNLDAKKLLNSIIQTQIFKVVSVKETNFTEEMPDELQKEIEKSKQEIKAGKIKSHETVMQKYQEWL